MIKRRTKRQQQKGRKEPKAKRKPSKRMLKKKTTLKMEIPKLTRYFSCTKAGNRARCAGSAAAGALLGSRGWGGLCHTVRTEQLCYLPRESLQEWPPPSCSVLEPFPRCCLLALGLPHSSARGLRSCGAQGQHHPAALSWLCTSLWTAGLLCCSARLGAGPQIWFWVLHSSLKLLFCLRTIQQEVCKVNSVLSLTCSLLSQVLAVAAPHLSWVQLRAPAAAEGLSQQIPCSEWGSVSSGLSWPVAQPSLLCSVTDSGVSPWVECPPSQGSLIFSFLKQDQELLG